MAHKKWRKGGNNISVYNTSDFCARNLNDHQSKNYKNAWFLFIRRWRGRTFSELTYLFLTQKNSTAPAFIPAISLICHSQMKGCKFQTSWTNDVAQHTSQSKRLPGEVKAGELSGGSAHKIIVSVRQTHLIPSATSDFLNLTKEFCAKS